MPDMKSEFCVQATGSGFIDFQIFRETGPSRSEAAGCVPLAQQWYAHFFELPPFLSLTYTDPFAACFVVTGDATPDGIHAVQSVFGAIKFPYALAHQVEKSRRSG